MSEKVHMRRGGQLTISGRVEKFHVMDRNVTVHLVEENFCFSIHSDSTCYKVLMDSLKINRDAKVTAHLRKEEMKLSPVTCISNLTVEI